jgi:amino acid transporter
MAITATEKPNEQKAVEMGRTISCNEGQWLASTNTGTKRGIKSRHVQMMAIGGAIGTSLFVGAGQALAIAGPATLLLAYITICVLVYGILTATCEMNTYIPVSGCSMAYYANRFVSPSLGCAMGWLYWYSFGIIVAYEITASAWVISYWPNNIPVGALITIMLVVVVALNFFPVKVYGESEFWFASLKVFMIIGLLILSFILFWGGGPNHQRLGFHYWKNPGAMNTYLVGGNTGRFCGYIYVVCYSVFSFNFTPELLVVSSSEMESPRKNLPRAAKMCFFRMLVFYIGAILAMGVICPSDASGLTNNSGVAASPFVIAIKEAGIHGLDSVINAVIITSAWSSGNSYLYMSSRSLYSLAVAGRAPSIFKRCNRWGVPYYAVLSSSLFAFLAYMNCNVNASIVFNWFVNLTNTAGFISWICCCIVFHRFRKAREVQSIPTSSLPYHSSLQPYLGWIATFAFPVLLLCNGFSVFFPGQWSVSSFLTAYVGAFGFLVIYLVHRVLNWKDPWIYKPEDVDLISGMDEVEALEVIAEVQETGVKHSKVVSMLTYLWE